MRTALLLTLIVTSLLPLFLSHPHHDYDCESRYQSCRQRVLSRMRSCPASWFEIFTIIVNLNPSRTLASLQAVVSECSDQLDDCRSAVTHTTAYSHWLLDVLDIYLELCSGRSQRTTKTPTTSTTSATTTTTESRLLACDSSYQRGLRMIENEMIDCTENSLRNLIGRIGDIEVTLNSCYAYGYTIPTTRTSSLTDLLISRVNCKCRGIGATESPGNVIQPNYCEKTRPEVRVIGTSRPACYTGAELLPGGYILTPTDDCQHFDQTIGAEPPSNPRTLHSCQQGTKFDLSYCGCNHASVVGPNCCSQST